MTLSHVHLSMYLSMYLSTFLLINAFKFESISYTPFYPLQQGFSTSAVLTFETR